VIAAFFRVGRQDGSGIENPDPLGPGNVAGLAQNPVLQLLQAIDFDAGQPLGDKLRRRHGASAENAHGIGEALGVG
jgi:hypothetical protein